MSMKLSRPLLLPLARRRSYPVSFSLSLSLLRERARGSCRSPILVVAIPKRKLRKPSRAYVSSGEINRTTAEGCASRTATLAMSPSVHPGVTLIFPTIRGFSVPLSPVSSSSCCWGYDKTELSKRVVFAGDADAEVFCIGSTVLLPTVAVLPWVRNHGVRR